MRLLIMLLLLLGVRMLQKVCPHHIRRVRPVMAWEVSEVGVVLQSMSWIPPISLVSNLVGSQGISLHPSLSCGKSGKETTFRTNVMMRTGLSDVHFYVATAASCPCAKLPCAEGCWAWIVA